MGRGDADDKVLGAHGREELNDSGERLFAFASDNKPATMDTSFSYRNGGISYRFNSISSCRGQKRLDYIPTRRGLRHRV